MDPDRYCLDAAAPPGSALYYATLFTGARERAALVSVHALRHVLLDIVETIADANVRAPKLNWWSGEIMDARDGSPHHPVALAITRNCGRPLWRHPEVFAMLAAVARVSAGGGIASEAARGEFCADVGGGTAGLCMAAVGFEAGGDGRERVRALGAALEGAMLASVPSVRSGLRRLPIPAPDSAGRADPDRSGCGPERIAEARARARRALADAVRGVRPHSGPVALVYRTLAHVQLAALAKALRKPAAEAPLVASVSPVRKLWIAWRASRGVEHVERAEHVDPRA